MKNFFSIESANYHNCYLVFIYMERDMRGAVVIVTIIISLLLLLLQLLRPLLLLQMLFLYVRLLPQLLPL